jgi:hypothetical protein
LTAGTSFQIRLQSITNPASTSSTDNFTFSVKNSNGYLINSYATDLKLTTTAESTITVASLTQSTFDAGTSGDITFSITLINSIAAGGMLRVIYPSQVTISASTLQASLTSPSSITSLAFTLTSSERRIDITDMFPSGATGGQTYIFVLKNVTNSIYAAATNSFTITTLTDSTGAYRIDKVSTGLTMTAT